MPDRRDPPLELPLDRYWDAVFLGGPAGSELEDRDPELAATVRRLRTLDAAPPADPVFATRLWEEVMRAQGIVGAVPLVPAARPAGSGAAPRRWRGVLPALPGTPERRRWALARLATAALLLLTLGAVYLAFVERPERQMPPVLLAPGTPTLADAMPMRGGDPAHTGVQPGPGPAGSPALRWRVPLEGGTWEVVVAGGVVYACDDAPRTSLLALDAGTGAEVWRADAAGGGGCSPPAVAGGAVYFTGGGILHAFDAATGAERWRFDLGAAEGSAPVVVDGVVYVGAGAYAPGAVYALDAATGHQVWRFATDGAPYADPAVADGVVYVATGTGGLGPGHTLHALDAASGQERWRADLAAGTFGAPAVADGTVYVGNAAGLFAFDAATGRERWRVGDSTEGAPAAAGGTVYQIDDERYLRAFDAATGQERWRVDINPSGRLASGLTPSQPTLVDGVVYVGSPDHTLYAVDTATGQERWHLATEAELLNSPTVLGGVVYLGGGGASGSSAVSALADEGTGGIPPATPGGA